MVDFWIILSFLGGCLAFWAISWGFHQAVERRTTSIINAKYAKMGIEKKQVASTEKAAMLLDLKKILDEGGDIKDKVGKFVGVASQYPNATEDLFKQVRRFI